MFKLEFKCFVMILLLCQYSFCQTTDEYTINIDETRIGDNWENWTENVPISGNVRVGLMVNQSEGKHFKPLSFYVALPQIKESTNLCIELSSKDGRYSGKLCVPLDPLKRGVYKINIPTRYKSKLLNFSTEEVVVLASLSNDIKLKPQTYILSSWIIFKLENIKSLHVYLNSLMPTRVKLSSNVYDEEPIQCEVMNSPTVAYNKECRFEIRKNLNNENESLVQIQQRRKRGSVSKIVNYEIALKF